MMVSRRRISHGLWRDPEDARRLVHVESSIHRSINLRLIAVQFRLIDVRLHLIGSLNHREAWVQGVLAEPQHVVHSIKLPARFLGSKPRLEALRGWR